MNVQWQVSRSQDQPPPAYAASRSSTLCVLLLRGTPRLVVMPSVLSFATRYVLKGAAQSRDRSTSVSPEQAIKNDHSTGPITYCGNGQIESLGKAEDRVKNDRQHDHPDFCFISSKVKIHAISCTPGTRTRTLSNWCNSGATGPAFAAAIANMCQ